MSKGQRERDRIPGGAEKEREEREREKGGQSEAHAHPMWDFNSPTVRS